ncbi:MAG: VWA domain-containing protein [Cyanobacteriota bacterium]|nr:VWA domain-containing protein [Cyanobacteriota bacterium]
MKVSVQPALNDASLDAAQPTNQRQLSVAVSAASDLVDRDVPLNLCLILDRSGSMGGKPLKIVKQAAWQIVDRMSPVDRLSVVAFDHRAKVLVENQPVEDPEAIKAAISELKASGGTAIDEGMKLGISELSKHNQDRISQAFLLTDGENEHGDNPRCLKLAKLAAEYNITLNGLGFGDRWNQDVLEAIADAGGGTLAYIAEPSQAVEEFSRLFARMQSVGLTNAHLILSLVPEVRLAELKPVAQVAPETIELPVHSEDDGRVAVRLGDLMVDAPRVILANLYVGKMSEGQHAIAQLQVRYDDPAAGRTEVLSDPIDVTANVVSAFVPSPDPEVNQHILALAKYRQTQIAETKLKKGDRSGAATMLQSAAKTALQMGDDGAATVLQKSATMLQQGETLSDSDRKKTRIVSKTILQKPSE